MPTADETTQKQAEAQTAQAMTEQERQALRDKDFAGKPGAVPQVDDGKFDRTTQQPTVTSAPGGPQTADEIEVQNRRIMQNRQGISGTIDGIGGRTPSQPHETVPGTQTTGNREVFENPDSNAQRVINPDPAMKLTGQPLRTPDVASGGVGGEGTDDDEPTPYDEQTVEDLREQARQREVNLHGATNKADIIKELKKQDRADKKAKESAA